MRRSLIIVLVLAILIGGATNAYLLVSTGAPFFVLWGLLFGAGVAVLGVAQALALARSEPAEAAVGRRPSVILLCGLMLAQGAMLPLAEVVHDRGRNMSER